jgi:hypothetical protein
MKIIGSALFRKKMEKIGNQAMIIWGRHLSDVDSSFSQFYQNKEKVLSYTRKIHNEKLSHAYIGAQLFAEIALVTHPSNPQFNKLFPSDWYDERNGEMVPDAIISLIILNQSNYFFAIISLIERGLEVPCYPLLRSMIENMLVLAAISTDKELLFKYIELSSTEGKLKKKLWSKYFSIKPLMESFDKILNESSEISKLMTENLSDHIHTMYSIYSDLAHPTHLSLRNLFSERRNKKGVQFNIWGIEGKEQKYILNDLLHLNRDFLLIFVSIYFKKYKNKINVFGLSYWAAPYSLALFYLGEFYEIDDINEETIDAINNFFNTNGAHPFEGCFKRDGK